MKVNLEKPGSCGHPDSRMAVPLNVLHNLSISTYHNQQPTAGNSKVHEGVAILVIILSYLI